MMPKMPMMPMMLCPCRHGPRAHSYAGGHAIIANQVMVGRAAKRNPMQAGGTHIACIVANTEHLIGQAKHFVVLVVACKV
jgi:hypothetical protein